MPPPPELAKEEQVTLKVGAALENVAVPVLLLNRRTTQSPVPEQSLDQPAKVDPASGVALRVNLVPELKYESSLPQGLGLTVPDPSPEQATDSRGRENSALTDLSESMVKVQGSVPEQSPDHRRKYDLLFGVAVRVTVVPEA